MKKTIKRIKRAFTRLFLKRIYKRRCRKLNIKYEEGIYIGKNVQNWGASVIMKKNSKVHDNTIFWGDGIIQIGENSSIGENSWIYANKNNGGVYIGDDVNCASHLYVIDSDHSFEKGKKINQQQLKSKPIYIGNDIWIGYNVTILKGTKIGDRTVIGACSLCNKEYAGNSVLVGSPAKIIKFID